MIEPLVTVGIPVYNGARHLAEALNSIANQEYANIEIIVADNGSTDNSLEIIESFAGKDSRIICLKSDLNIGYSKNVNRILKNAKGDYVSIFHGDDQYYPEIIKCEVEFLLRNPSCGGVFTQVNCINENGLPIPRELLVEKLGLTSDLILELQDYLKWMTLVGNILICPSGMIRNSIYAKVGLYNESIVFVEDQDMWLRILEIANLGIIARPLMNYRIHAKQISQTYRAIDRDYLNIPLQHLCEYLDQKPQYEAFRERLSFLIADDLIQIAKRNFLKLQFSQCKNYLAKARASLRGSFFEYSKYREAMVLCIFIVSLYRAISKRLNFLFYKLHG